MLKQITPFVPCTTLADQIAFYRDVLGFTVGFQEDNYAFLRRDAVAIRLVEVSADVDLHHPERQGSFYIDVEDVDALYARTCPGACHPAQRPGSRAFRTRTMGSVNSMCPTRIARWSSSAPRSDRPRPLD